MPLERRVADDALAVERDEHERRLVELLPEALGRDDVVVRIGHVAHALGVEREGFGEAGLVERRDTNPGRRLARALVAAQVEHELDLSFHFGEAAAFRPRERLLAYRAGGLACAERGRVRERDLEQPRAEPAPAVLRHDCHRQARPPRHAPAGGGEREADRVVPLLGEEVAAAVPPSGDARSDLVARDRRLRMDVRPDACVRVEIGVALGDADAVSRCA